MVTILKVFIFRTNCIRNSMGQALTDNQYYVNNKYLQIYLVSGVDKIFFLSSSNSSLVFIRPNANRTLLIRYLLASFFISSLSMVMALKS